MTDNLIAIAMACLAVYGWNELLHLQMPGWLFGSAIGLLAWGLLAEWGEGTDASI